MIKLFDECIKQAIELGRKHMDKYEIDNPNKPTKEEWQLALVLFANKIK